MVSCAACGCSQTKTTKDKGMTFHKFPKNEKIRKFWIEFVNRPNWTPAKQSCLCSSHFSQECFDRSSSLIVRLRENALPTLTVTRVKYVRSFYEEECFSEPSTSQAAQLLMQEVEANIPKSATCNFTVNSKNQDDNSQVSTPINSSQFVDCKIEVKVENQDYIFAEAPSPITSLQLTPDDTTRLFLERKLNEMYKMDKIKSNKIRYLQKKNWAQKKKITALTTIVADLKSKNVFLKSMAKQCLVQQYNSNDHTYHYTI
ncbi:uncharacterized protein LOC115883722 [Sitophilus oryzae]|uniref:Uncharacterized protein LOC115883722 n=1 Tax=Sitophilus oryzae TaxID=7048 RepID=A0A6J2Y2Q1_SITOR|nr:uncharacterized protein LOC115883722 [Sitophilus oryzae]